MDNLSISENLLGFYHCIEATSQSFFMKIKFAESFVKVYRSGQFQSGKVVTNTMQQKQFNRV